MANLCRYSWHSVYVRRYKKENAWAVLILNDSDQAVSETYSIYDLIGTKEAWVFYWEPGFSLGLGKATRIATILSSHETKLYFISEEKENPALIMSIGGRELRNN